jgi:hypothetical protein
MAVGTMQTGKLFETAVENLFRAGQVIATPLAFLVQTRKLDTRPELIFKRFRLTAAALRIRVLWMMMAQDAIEKPIKINMISLTRRLAFRNKSRIFMSVTA